MMEIILLERVDNLGAMGEVVTVKPGYARNFLLPQQKALRATEANMARFEAEREFLEQRNVETRVAAEDEGKGIDGRSYVMIRKAGDTGQLFGSVSTRDIVKAVGEPVRRNMVKLEQPIKALGLHEVMIKLHPEVTVTITVNVARSDDEAGRQAIGEDVIAAQIEEDRAEAEAAAAEAAEIAAEMFDNDYAPGEVAEEATEDKAKTG